MFQCCIGFACWKCVERCQQQRWGWRLGDGLGPGSLLLDLSIVDRRITSQTFTSPLLTIVNDPVETQQPKLLQRLSSLNMRESHLPWKSPSDTPLDSVSSSFPQNYFHIFPPFSLADKLGKTVERVPGAVGVHQYPMFTRLPRPHNTSLQTNKTSTTSTINNPLTNS